MQSSQEGNQAKKHVKTWDHEKEDLYFYKNSTSLLMQDRLDSVTPSGPRRSSRFFKIKSGETRSDRDLRKNRSLTSRTTSSQPRYRRTATLAY